MTPPLGDRTASLLTLTTDFGNFSPYVASLKGVVLGIAPGAQIVDVCHSIAPQDIAGASFLLTEVVRDFPNGTVHLVVVDPGVGTNRRLIGVEVDGHRFVLPDNGLIGGVLQRSHSPVMKPGAGTLPFPSPGLALSGSPKAWEIRNPELRRSTVSPTFHGRDILAPTAAFLLNGGDLADLGPPVEDLVLLPIPEAVEDGDGIVGEVVFLDSFGNLITNITRDRLGPETPRSWTIEILGHFTDGLIRTYADRAPGTLVGLIGSFDRVEVAVVNGDAARCLGAGRGTPVRLRRKLGTHP